MLTTYIYTRNRISLNVFHALFSVMHKCAHMFAEMHYECNYVLSKNFGQYLRAFNLFAEFHLMDVVGTELNFISMSNV